MPRYQTQLLVLAVLVAACLCCFWRLTLNPGDLLVGNQAAGNNDLTQYFLASRGYMSLPARQFGQAPYWNPYTLCGAPFVGNPQSAIYYPPNWLFFWLAPTKIASWAMVLHHMWGAIGAYLLCRRYGCSEFAALTGAIVMLASPYLMLHTAAGHYSQICVVSWLPWAFLAYERVRDNQRYGVLAMTVVLALGFFAGHVQELLYLVLTLSACLVWDIVAQIRKHNSMAAIQLTRSWLLIGMATGGLVAIDLIPIIIYTNQAVRAGGLTLQEAGAGLGVASLGQSLSYFGIVPLLLAVIGVVKNWDKSASRRWFAITTFWFLFALGAAGLLFSVCYYVVPGVALFRCPWRALFICSLAVAVLSGMGVDAVVHLARNHLGRYGKVIAYLGAAAACTAELSVSSGAVLRTIPYSDFREENRVAKLLGEDVGNARVFAEQSLLSDREAYQHDIQKVQGYEPVPTANCATAIAGLAPNEDPAKLLVGFDPTHLSSLDKRLVDLVGIRYALVQPQETTLPPGWKPRSKGYLREEVTLRGERILARPYELYENETALPRAFVIGKARIIHDDDDFAETLQSLNPQSELVLEHDVLPPGPRSRFRPASIEKYTPNRVEIEAVLDQPGYLFLSDTWYPGWRATVNGTQFPVLKANLAFRAVPLPAGQHRVVFRYTPAGLTIGAMLTIVTAACLCLVSVRVNAPVPHPVRWLDLGPRPAGLSQTQS